MDLIITLVVVVIALFYFSGRRHPLMKCPTCKGSGVLYSGVLSHRYPPCPRCGRKGEINAW
jgi:hypothetical protein